MVFTGLQNGGGGRLIWLANQMSRSGYSPRQRPPRPQGGRFTPTLGMGAALVTLLWR